MSQKLPALCARTTIFFLILAVGAAIWPSRAAAQPALDTKPGEVKVTDIPDEIIKKFKLDTTFYKKHIDYHGFSILSSAKVSDAGLIEARHLIDQLLGERSDILKAMIKAGCRFMVMSPTEMTTDVPEQRRLKNDPKTNWDKRARGLGGKLSSCGEENLLNLKGDRYNKENILIHEFNHAIHQHGLRAVDPTFDGRLREAYKKAMAKDLWKGTYLTTNHSEYWAEGAQAYFDCMRPQYGANTREKLQKYDPDLFALVDEVYKQSKFRYVRYDQLADRWLVVIPIFRRLRFKQNAPAGKSGGPVQLSLPGRDGQPGPAKLLYQPPEEEKAAGKSGGPRPKEGSYAVCYAVSTGPDPLGSYHRYLFARPLFPDYPRPAVWPDGYYVTTSTSDDLIQRHAFVVERAKMLKGEAATEQGFVIDGVNFLNNADLDGKQLPPAGAPNIMMAAGGAQLKKVLQDDGIYVWKFSVDWADPSKSKLDGPVKIPVAPYHYMGGG